MEILYVMWPLLLCFSIIIVLVMASKESKAARRRESAIDPMFRRNRPSARPHTVITRNR
ncbi:MAG: hypothetical protein ABSC19_21300 [Syntrophorhabdales bacterium]|jgi:hypothetical protein